MDNYTIPMFNGNYDFRKMYNDFNKKYNPYPVDMSRAAAFSSALSDGLITKEIYDLAHKYYGPLWNYVDNSLQKKWRTIMDNSVKEIYVIYHTWMQEDLASEYGYMEPCEKAVGFVWTEDEAQQLIAQWSDKFLPDGSKYKEDQEFDYRKLPLALLDVSPFNRKEN